MTTNIPELVCSVCDATARDTPTERGRFLRRHPGKCQARLAYTKQVAAGVRCVESEEREERRRDGKAGRAEMVGEE